MLTIQQVGTEIMSGNPKHFYVMTGSEYGVKQMYIQYLKDHYNEYKESDTVESILSTMTTKQSDSNSSCRILLPSLRATFLPEEGSEYLISSLAYSIQLARYCTKHKNPRLRYRFHTAT